MPTGKPLLIHFDLGSKTPVDVRDKRRRFPVLQSFQAILGAPRLGALRTTS
jgi:hypothetical protein